MKQFKIGDKVKFLDDVGGGIVTSVFDNKIVVKIENGLEFPVDKKKIIHDLSDVAIYGKNTSDDIFQKNKSKGRKISAVTTSVKKVQQKQRKAVKTTKNNIEEVDLHVLLPDEEDKKLGNYSILQKQLDFFVAKIESSIRQNKEKIVFIHGTGTGKLRSELRRILDERYPNLYYHDASYVEYGFGATMVYFRKKQ